jgi:hypothetical protein
MACRERVKTRGEASRGASFTKPFTKVNKLLSGKGLAKNDHNAAKTGQIYRAEHLT